LTNQVESLSVGGAPREHERVVLTGPVPADGLVAGDVGTVVHVYPGAAAFEVEFLRLDGSTAAVATVEAGALRRPLINEITSARDFERPV